MKYRIEQKYHNEDFSTVKIQMKFLFMWFNVNVAPKYECSISSARKWIELKNKGYPVNVYYYE